MDDSARHLFIKNKQNYVQILQLLMLIRLLKRNATREFVDVYDM